MHQLRSAVPSIHPSGCHLRTCRSGKEIGHISSPDMPPSCGRELWSLLSPVPLQGLPTADIKAPLMSCTLKTSPAPTISNPSERFCFPAEHRIASEQVPSPYPTFKTSFFSSTGA